MWGSYKDQLKALLVEKDSKTTALLDELRVIESEYCLKLKEISKRYNKLYSLFTELYTADEILNDPQNETLASLLQEKTVRGTLDRAGINNFLRKYRFNDNGELLPIYTMTVLESGTLRITDKDLTSTEIANMRFWASANYLYIGDDFILVAGGYNDSTSACLVHAKTHEIIHLPPLNTRRKWEAVSFIGNKPAVIGGATLNKERLKSVEVFDDVWKEIAPLTIARSSHAAARSEQATYVFGGKDKVEYIDTVEKYCEEQWMILSCKLPFCGISVGVYYLERGNFILLGGCLGNNRSEKVYLWSEEEVQELPSLTEKVSFPWNNWIREGNVIISYRDPEKTIISYTLPDLY